TLPQAPGQGGGLTREQALRRRAEDVMRDLGFDAVVSLSLADPGLPERLRLPQDDQRRAPIRVPNPLSLAHSGRLTTLLGALGPATAFQIHLAELVAGSSFGREQYEDVTTYPEVHQDLAIVVADDVPAARVRQAVLAGGGELLRSARVFDLYRGEQVGPGRKS